MRFRPIAVGGSGLLLAFTLVHCEADSGSPSSGDAAVDITLPDAANVSPTDGAAPADGGVTVDGGIDAAPVYDDGGCLVVTETLPDPAAAGLPTSGLVLWLRAEQGLSTTVAGDVCRWEDLSGKGNDFAPADKRPKLGAGALRGRPAVTFAGTDTVLRRADVLGIAATSGRTVAAFGSATDTTGRFNYFYQGNYATNDDYWGLDQNAFNTTGSKEGVYVTGNAYDSNVATSTAPRSHVYAIDTFTPGGAILGAVHYDIDGVATTLTRTTGGTGNGNIEDFSGATRSEVGLGRAGFGGASLGELIVYGRALDATERSALNTYFQTRYPQ